LPANSGPTGPSGKLAALAGARYCTAIPFGAVAGIINIGIGDDVRPELGGGRVEIVLVEWW